MTDLATMSYLAGAGVDWLSGEAVVGLNLPEERSTEAHNNSRVNQKNTTLIHESYTSLITRFVSNRCGWNM